MISVTSVLLSLRILFVRSSLLDVSLTRQGDSFFTEVTLFLNDHESMRSPRFLSQVLRRSIRSISSDQKKGVSVIALEALRCATTDTANPYHFHCGR